MTIPAKPRLSVLSVSTIERMKFTLFCTERVDSRMETMKKVSPTRRRYRKTGRKRPILARRAIPEIPEIFVYVSEEGFGHPYKRAHLRNKRGYVYLCWREGARVRNFYLGKAPRKSPTLEGSAAGAGELELELQRRARK